MKLRKAHSLLPGILAAALMTGCVQTQHDVRTEHKIEPIVVRTEHEIKPIHITVDVNLRVQNELNDFFGDIDEESTLVEYDPSDPLPATNTPPQS